jgi:hypothetical protein
MSAAELIVIAIAVFAMGTAVTIGIRREEGLFNERRRRLQDQGEWGPHGPDQYFPEVAPDRVTHGARAITGLWVRRDQGTDPLTVPWYERRV